MNYLSRFIIATLLASSAFSAFLFPAPVSAANVGVSINIGDPNFYGQIDIGNVPQPRFIYAEPIIIERDYYQREPLYLRVPPGHAKHWSKHCREYQACGRPVYFVEDRWYTQEYVPYYRSHGHDRGRDYRNEHHDEGRHDDGRYEHHGDDHRDNDHHGNDQHDNGHGKH